MVMAPDLSTLRLCSMLSSFAFAVVFLALWHGNREARYLGHWAASSVIYVAVMLAFEIRPPPFGITLGCVLFAALSGSNVFLLSGVRILEGRAAFARWMVVPSLVSMLCFAGPVALRVSGVPVSTATGSVVVTAGLAFGMTVFGMALLRGAKRNRVDDGAHDSARGRRIAGLALLGYLPGYALSIAATLTPFDGINTLAMFAMLSDQVLLVVINLGLLAMRGDLAMGQLRESAARDGLTGVRNRAWLTANRHRPAIASAAVVIVDVDHFKRVNDRHGHAAGDTVLRTLAERMAALCEPVNGHVVRLGGDEFMVILPGAAEADVRGFAEHARQMAGRPIAEAPRITISLGVAVAQGPAPTLGDTMAEADRAMYAAKATGRDRVAA